MNIVNLGEFANDEFVPAALGQAYVTNIFNNDTL